MLDAYTVRKAVPRILLAVVGINISIYLCVAAVDITVIISRGVEQLLTTPFVGTDGIKIDGEQFDGNPVTSGVLTVITLLIIKSVIAGPGAIAIIMSIFPLIMIVGLIALGVLFTLVIRQALIIFLTVVSPVAIACFVLPGTEKYFKQWLDLFIKTLMVYPIIAVIFAMSHVLGAILLSDATGSTVMNSLSTTASINSIQYFAQAAEGGNTDQTIKLIAAILVIYAPLVLIPFAFKLAGGAIATIANAADNATKRRRAQIGDRRQKGLDERTASNREKMAAGERYKGRNFLSRRANTALQTASIMGSGKVRRSKVQAERAVRDSVAFKKGMESEHVQAVIANDDLLDAYANDGMAGARRYFETNLGMTGRELDQNLAMVKAAEATVGTKTFAQIAAVANAATGSGYAGGSVQMLRAIDRAAGGDVAARGRMVAAARSNAERANRPDLAAPFAASMQTMAAISEGRLDDDELASTLDREVIRTKGASVTMQSRGQAANRLIGGTKGELGELGRMLAESDAELKAASDEVKSAKTPTKVQTDRLEAAETESLRLQATLANMYDASSYGPEENAQRLGHIMSQTSGRTVTAEDGTVRELSRLELLKYNRSDVRFQAFRREMYDGDSTAANPDLREQIQRSIVPPKT